MKLNHRMPLPPPRLLREIVGGRPFPEPPRFKLCTTSFALGIMLGVLGSSVLWFMLLSIFHN